MPKKDNFYWSILVPKELDDAVERAMKETGWYQSKNELIRDAVRRWLESMDFAMAKHKVDVDALNEAQEAEQKEREEIQKNLPPSTKEEIEKAKKRLKR